MNLNTALPLLATAWLVGCADPARAPSAAPRPSFPSEQVSHCVGAPMTARWTQVTKHPNGTGTHIVLEGVVEMPGAAPGAVTVTARLPEGAVAASPTSLNLGLVPHGGRAPMRLVLDYAATPTKDLMVEIDARDGDDFAHVTLAYRFGRPAPDAVIPRFDGPRLVLHGLDLGPSIADGIVADRTGL